MSYYIVRSDGHYYLGTMDGNPVFGHGESAAVFENELYAEMRMDWLASLDNQRTFELEEQEPVPPKQWKDTMRTFDIDTLPSDFKAPGGHAWAQFEKKVPLKAIRIAGPFEVVTVHGSETGETVYCKDGWLALDASGFPYPITHEEIKAAYRPIANRGR